MLFQPLLAAYAQVAAEVLGLLAQLVARFVQKALVVLHARDQRARQRGFARRSAGQPGQRRVGRGELAQHREVKAQTGACDVAAADGADRGQEVVPVLRVLAQVLAANVFQQRIGAQHTGSFVERCFLRPGQGELGRAPAHDPGIVFQRAADELGQTFVEQFVVAVVGEQARHAFFKRQAARARKHRASLRADSAHQREFLRRLARHGGLGTLIDALGRGVAVQKTLHLAHQCLVGQCGRLHRAHARKQCPDMADHGSAATKGRSTVCRLPVFKHPVAHIRSATRRHVARRLVQQFVDTQGFVSGFGVAVLDALGQHGLHALHDGRHQHVVQQARVAVGRGIAHCRHCVQTIEKAERRLVDIDARVARQLARAAQHLGHAGGLEVSEQRAHLGRQRRGALADLAEVLVVVAGTA